MQSIMIVYNESKPHACQLAKEIDRFVSKMGYQTTLEISGTPHKKKFPVSKAKNLFLVISIGGDGTVLGVARDYLGVPILALGAGRVGFITEVPMAKWKESLLAFCEGKSQMSPHLMFEVALYREGKLLFKEYGLNEMVVASKEISRLVDLSVEVDEIALGQFRADGVLVATPTGSTAYNAAAGGPVLAPGVEAFVINPKCAFSLSSRAVVVAGKCKIKIEVTPLQRTSLNLTVDGQIMHDLEPNDIMMVKRSRYNCNIIKYPDRNFYQVLREKLHWSGGNR